MKSKLPWILAACVLASLAVLAVARAAPDAVSFTAQPDSVEIPFLLRGNHVLVRGTINLSDSLWFVVDSGAGSHVVNRATAERLGLEVEGGLEALGAGGRVAAGMAHDVRFHLPGVDITGPFTAVIDLDDVALQSGQDCDGIVGFPLFDHAVVTIDYARSILVVRDPGRFRSNAPSLKLAFADNHPYIDGAVTLPGGKPIRGSFVLDTGSALALVLSPGFVERERALATAPRTITGRLGGVGGHGFHPIGRIDELVLGPYVLARPIVVFSSPGPGKSSVAGSIGNIGGDVLQRFRVTFDYPHRRLYLEPGPALDRPFEADMTGLVLSAQSESLHAIEVLRVQAESPANALGISVGDIVESVDGAPLTPAGMPEFRKRMRTEGESLRLGLRRGAIRTEVTLTTRRQI